MLPARYLNAHGRRYTSRYLKMTGASLEDLVDNTEHVTHADYDRYYAHIALLS